MTPTTSSLRHSAAGPISHLHDAQLFGSRTVSQHISETRVSKPSPAASLVSPPIFHSLPVAQSGLNNVAVPPMPSVNIYSQPPTSNPYPPSPAETLLPLPAEDAAQDPLFAITESDNIPKFYRSLCITVAATVSSAPTPTPAPGQSLDTKPIYRTQTEVDAAEIAAGRKAPLVTFKVSGFGIFGHDNHDQGYVASCKAGHLKYLEARRQYLRSIRPEASQTSHKKKKSDSRSGSKAQTPRQARVKKVQKPLPPPIGTRSSSARSASVGLATTPTATTASTAIVVSPAASAAAYAVAIAASAEPMIVDASPAATSKPGRRIILTSSTQKPVAAATVFTPVAALAPATAVISAPAPVTADSTVTASPRSRRAMTSGATRGVAGSGVFPIDNYPRESGRRGAVASREDKDFDKLPDICPPLETLNRIPAGALKTDWKGNPIDLSDDCHLGLLHEQERVLASTLRLDCATYLTSKRRLFLSRLDCLERNKTFRKTDAQTACHIDVNKASRLYVAYQEIGWLDESWVEEFKGRVDLSAVQKMA